VGGSKQTLRRSLFSFPLATEQGWVVVNVGLARTLYIGLARTVYLHRKWAYIWWFPCQKYRIHTVYIWFWPTLIIYTPYMTVYMVISLPKLPFIPYRLGFSPQLQKNILVSHSRINPAPWKYLIYTNPAQGFLPDRLQNTPKIPIFQSRTPKINRFFSCAQSPRRAKNDIFARWYKVCTVHTVYIWFWPALVIYTPYMTVCLVVLCQK
jgi:hypothetical protein